MNKINVAIADDNQRTVEMMTELLEQESDIEVIASADDGEEALRIIKEKQPDVVLLDLIMPKMDGLSVMEKVNMDEQITGYHYAETRWNWCIRTFANRRSK